MLNLSHIKEIDPDQLSGEKLKKALVTSTAPDWAPHGPLPEVKPHQRQGQHQDTELPVTDSGPPSTQALCEAGQGC